jgi:hypothetical protein
MSNTPQMTRFYIASLTHTGREHEHIGWWGKNWRGYTPVVGDYVGEYELADAVRLNDGEISIAVPIAVVRTLLTPEPYFRPANPARWYDQRGPVVLNNRTNWNALISASLAEGRQHRPKPDPFRGARRAFALPASTAEHVCEVVKENGDAQRN